MFESRILIAVTLALCVLASPSYSVNPLVELHYKVGVLIQKNDDQRCRLLTKMSKNYLQKAYPSLSGVYNDLLQEVIIPGFEIANQVGDASIKEGFSDVTKAVTEEIARSKNSLIKCEKDIETLNKLRLKVSCLLRELNFRMSYKFEEEKNPKKTTPRGPKNSPS